MPQCPSLKHLQITEETPCRLDLPAELYMSCGAMTFVQAMHQDYCSIAVRIMELPQAEKAILTASTF